MDKTWAKARAIAEQVERARDTMRGLYSSAEEYREKLEPWRETVRKLSAQRNITALEVPLLLRDDITDMQMVALIAAAADVTEEQAQRLAKAGGE